MYRIFTLNAQGQLQETTGASHALQAWQQPSAPLWISLEAPTQEDLHFLQQHFNLHPAHIRNLCETSNSPRFSPQADLNYLHIHRIFYDFEAEICDFRNISMLYSKNALITLTHPKLQRTLQNVQNRLRQDPQHTFNHGSGLIVLHLLEGLVHDYHPAVSEWQETLGNIEAMVLKERDESVIDHILRFKKLVTALHKYLMPQKLVLTQLYERFSAGQQDDYLAPFYKNVLDELCSLLRELDGVNAMAGSVFDTYAALLSLDLNRSTHKLNTVMQRLNVLSAIFLPLTFIVGVYGMNIHDIPELQWHGFYYVLWGFMLSMVFTMLFLFKKMRWY